MESSIYRVANAADGSLRPELWDKAKTLDAASASLPDGAYTTLRTYGKSGIIVLKQHFDRLEESAALLGQPIRLDRAALSTLLCTVLRMSPWPETRMRVTVDCSERPGELWISVEPLRTPDGALYQRGAACLTRSMQRKNPTAKYTQFISASRAERELVGAEVNELLMVDDTGQILEGLSSNFFAFYQGSLYTADDGVLHGITRTLILDEALQATIPVKLSAPRMEWLAALDEAFISSASRAVMPVTRIDDRVIGMGEPGPISRLLLERYRTRLGKEIEDVCLAPEHVT